jgi:hypothetical protein
LAWLQKKRLWKEFQMLVGDNTNKGGAADYCCSKRLLVKTPTRAVLPIIVVPNACW